MNLLDSRNLVLKYIDEYSTDGVLNSEGENKDYLLKHNQYADTVQKELATIYKIDAIYDFDIAPDSSYSLKRYPLPSDYMSKNNLFIEDNMNYEAVNFKIVGSNMLIPSNLSGKGHLHYYKYPNGITDTTALTYEYELKPEVAKLIPIKVAALIAMSDTSKIDIYTQLMQLYEMEKPRPNNPRSFIKMR